MVKEFNKIFSVRQLRQGVIQTLMQLPDLEDVIGILFLACRTNPLHSLLPSICVTNAV
jgi:hypothetical protein